jgi:hypothetical protein
MPDDTGAKVKRLAERLREEAAKAGLTLRGFSFVPNLEDDGPDMVQAAFTLDVEAELAGEDAVDQSKVDAEFNRIMAADRDAARIKDARDALARRLEEGGGILDDDD